MLKCVRPHAPRTRWRLNINPRLFSDASVMQRASLLATEYHEPEWYERPRRLTSRRPKEGSTWRCSSGQLRILRGCQRPLHADMPASSDCPAWARPVQHSISRFASVPIVHDLIIPDHTRDIAPGCMIRWPGQRMIRNSLPPLPARTAAVKDRTSSIVFKWRSPRPWSAGQSPPACRFRIASRVRTGTQELLVCGCQALCPGFEGCHAVIAPAELGPRSRLWPPRHSSRKGLLLPLLLPLLPSHSLAPRTRELLKGTTPCICHWRSGPGVGVALQCCSRAEVGLSAQTRSSAANHT